MKIPLFRSGDEIAVGGTSGLVKSLGIVSVEKLGCEIFKLTATVCILSSADGLINIPPPKN